MKHKQHRLGVSEVNLVNRHFRLVTPIDSTKLNQAIAEIDQLYGLDEVTFDEKSTKSDFSYDLSRLMHRPRGGNSDKARYSTQT